jgi:alpha-beta hydrolase superfamily lysophospholipase
VTFRTSDGVRLSGWYVPSRNGAALLLLPGAGSTRTSLVDHAAVLARHGYGTLLLDTRGHGRSGGDAMDFGWYGNLDVAAATAFLERQPDVTGRIGVLGLSMGGEQAIVAAGSDPRIRAVVAEGVTGQQAADHGWLPQGVDGQVQRGLEWVLYGAADLLSGASRPPSMRDAIAAAPSTPMLIIAGGRVPDEPIAGRWFRAASPETVRLWVVPGAGHTHALETAADQWTRAVVSFLNSELRPA